MFWARTVTRRRYSAQVLGTDRRPVAPSHSDVDVAATVQPLSQNARLVLPEGVRQDEAIKVFAPVGTFRLGGQVSGVVADDVVVEGLPDVRDGVYRVQALASWAAPLPHDEAACTLVQALVPRAGTPEEAP